jgi:hypothetical protein
MVDLYPSENLNAWNLLSVRHFVYQLLFHVHLPRFGDILIWINRSKTHHTIPLVATSADSVLSSYLVCITIAPIGTTFGNLQWRRYLNDFTFEYSSNNNIFSFVAMSADSVPSSKTNIFQNKLIYCRHFRTYSRCAMFDWSDTVFRQRNVTHRRISNTNLNNTAPSISTIAGWGLERS